MGRLLAARHLAGDHSMPGLDSWRGSTLPVRTLFAAADSDAAAAGGGGGVTCFGWE